MHQEREYPGRIANTGLRNPDFAALARAYGAVGETVIKTAEFQPAFEKAGCRLRGHFPEAGKRRPRHLYGKKHQNCDERRRT